MPKKLCTPIERFFKHVDKAGPNGCWLWVGAKDSDGYGHFGIEGGKRGLVVQAHRAAWTLFKGPIPAGLWVLHKCDNPPCVNPVHLFLGTRKDNMDDMVRKGRSRKLPPRIIACIRRLRARGKTYPELENIFEVCKDTLHAIVNRRFSYAD